MLTAKNVKFQFGNFLQPTEPPKTNNTKNSMDERTTDAIYCRPSGNAQGGFWVYKLSTAQVVHRNTATLAHSSDAIAEQVESIAFNEQMPEGIPLEIDTVTLRFLILRTILTTIGKIISLMMSIPITTSN